MLGTFIEILILKDINVLQRKDNIYDFYKEKHFQVCNKNMYTIYIMFLYL